MPRRWRQTQAMHFFCTARAWWMCTHTHSYTKVPANTHFTLLHTLTHSNIHRNYLTSHRQKLLHSPLVTHNTNTITEFKKSHSYTLYYALCLRYPLMFIPTWTHTHTENHKYISINRPIVISHQLYSHDILNTENRARIKITLLNDFSSFGSEIFFLQLHTQDLGIGNNNSNWRRKSMKYPQDKL